MYLLLDEEVIDDCDQHLDTRRHAVPCDDLSGNRGIHFVNEFYGYTVHDLVDETELDTDIVWCWEEEQGMWEHDPRFEERIRPGICPHFSYYTCNTNGTLTLGNTCYPLDQEKMRDKCPLLIKEARERKETK